MSYKVGLQKISKLMRAMPQNLNSFKINLNMLFYVISNY